MLDVHAILTLTEPAATHGDDMARLELRHDLHALIVSLERRHALPTADERSPLMQFRASLIGTLRAFEDMHGLENLIPRRVVYRVERPTSRVKFRA